MLTVVLQFLACIQSCDVESNQDIISCDLMCVERAVQKDKENFHCYEQYTDHYEQCREIKNSDDRATCKLQVRQEIDICLS